MVLRTNAQLVSNNDRTSLLIKNDLVSYHREDKNGRGGVGELAQDFGLRHVFILTAFSHFLTAWLNIALPLQDQGAKPGRKWQGSGVTNRNRFYVQCCANEDWRSPTDPNNQTEFLFIVYQRFLTLSLLGEKEIY